MILILGEGTLAMALQTYFTLHGIEHKIVGRNTSYDFTSQDDCNGLVEKFASKVTILINTIGMIPKGEFDYWDAFLTNYVAPGYLTLMFTKRMKPGSQIINISSASAWWTSYPDMDINRFVYNTTKTSLSDFGKYVNRMFIDDSKITITTIEPGAFQSKMSDYKGMSVEDVVSVIVHAIESKTQHVSLIKKG